MEEQKSIEIYNAFCVSPSKIKPWNTFFYIDCPQYLADKLFDKYGIKPLFIREQWTYDGKYTGITVVIRKKKTGDFLAAMYELQRNMLICGYADYEQFCREIDELVGGEE